MNTAQIAALDIVIQHGNLPAIQALWASLSPIAVAGALGVADTSAAQPTALAAAALATPAAAAAAQSEVAAWAAAAPPAKGKGKAATGKKPKSEAIVLDADEEAPAPKGKGKAKEAKPKGIAKKEKAPRAPRARTAYILWGIRERQKIKDTRPVPVFDSPAALMTELGRRWKALPEERKAKWHAKSAEEQRDIDDKKEAGASAEGEASGVEEEEE